MQENNHGMISETMTEREMELYDGIGNKMYNDTDIKNWVSLPHKNEQLHNKECGIGIK